MRHPLLLIFVSDWRRKLTALGLAFALWLWVDGQVADKQTHTLRIITTSVERAVEPGTLQIRMPEGWTLMQSPGNSSISEVEFDLVGSGAQIEAFLATGFSASFDAELDRLPGTTDLHPLSIPVLDLKWSRPDQADTLLAKAEGERSLRFQFVKLQTATIEVGPYLLDITGEAAEGYVVLNEELSFSGLTDIQIEGPATVLGPMIGQLPKRQRAFEVGDFEEVKEFAALLEPLALDGQRRDIQVQIRLSPGHIQNGIRLVEEYVVVNLPIRLADPNPRPIPLEANIEYQLQIEWTLADLEDDVKAEVLRRLKILFEDPSKQTVTVQRKR
jgi:hypothetical protein